MPKSTPPSQRDIVSTIIALALVPTLYIFLLDDNCGKVTSHWVSVEECTVSNDPTSTDHLKHIEGVADNSPE